MYAFMAEHVLIKVPTQVIYEKPTWSQITVNEQVYSFSRVGEHVYLLA